MRLSLNLWGLLLLLPPATLAAQAVVPSAVVAVIVDTTGGPLAGAICELTPAGAAPREVIADSDGRCRFPAVAAGSHRLRVSLDGFDPQSVTVQGAPGAPERRVTLAPARISESVIVSATRMPTPVSALPNTVTIVDQQII